MPNAVQRETLAAQQWRDRVKESRIYFKLYTFPDKDGGRKREKRTTTSKPWTHRKMWVSRPWQETCIGSLMPAAHNCCKAPNTVVAQLGLDGSWGEFAAAYWSQTMQDLATELGITVNLTAAAGPGCYCFCGRCFDHQHHLHAAAHGAAASGSCCFQS